MARMTRRAAACAALSSRRAAAEAPPPLVVFVGGTLQDAVGGLEPVFEATTRPPVRFVFGPTPRDTGAFGGKAAEARAVAGAGR